MRDITKCGGEGCGMRNECDRFTSPVGEWQVWFARSPHDGKTCMWIVLNEGVDDGDRDFAAVHV